MCACYVQQSFCFFHPSLMYAHMHCVHIHTPPPCLFCGCRFFSNFDFKLASSSPRVLHRRLLLLPVLWHPKPKKRRRIGRSDSANLSLLSPTSASPSAHYPCALTCCFFCIHAYLHPYLLTHLPVYMQTYMHSCVHT